MTAPARRPFRSLPASQRAGMLCAEARFRAFVAARLPGGSGTVTEGAAAEYLRRFCGVRSRRHLEFDPDAAARLAMLETEYDAWRGRIAPPDHDGQGG